MKCLKSTENTREQDEPNPIERRKNTMKSIGGDDRTPTKMEEPNKITIQGTFPNEQNNKFSFENG